ncbi:hypothetical protein V501_00879 [Pseudogymnoascus sp. VKM F-4519 (FW-2642)]|nr:hypothetical protein V501_00879 [Pseudogymnoascus sp. VKM F-4519 (FW-2642)]
MPSNETAALIFAEISAKSSESVAMVIWTTLVVLFANLLAEEGMFTYCNTPDRTPESQPQSSSRFLHEAENYSTPQPGVPIVRDCYSDLHMLIRHQTSLVGNLWSSQRLSPSISGRRAT